MEFVTPRDVERRFPDAVYGRTDGHMAEPSVCDDGYWGEAAKTLRGVIERPGDFPSLMGIQLDRGWDHPAEEGYDTSRAAVKKFRAWARTRYGNDVVALRAAWFDGGAKFEELLAPNPEEAAGSGTGFIRSGRRQRRVVDPRPAHALNPTKSRMPLKTLRLLATLASPLLLAGSQAVADEPARATTGALVIVGGGGMPDPVRDRFMTLAGGKAARLVVIPTASASADVPAEEASYLEPWKRYEPTSLVLLHTRDRAKADDPTFARAINEATAVWFSGGDQSKLTAAYRGTAVDRAMRALLARGGVIGGTSAGAAVMSEIMIEGGDPKAEVGRGFGFVTNAVVDQHFLRRSRLNRLLGVLADHPTLIGLGIDEGTALVIEGDRWSVVGRSYVIACEVDQQGKPTRFASFGDGDHGVFPKTGLPTLARPARRED